MSYGQIHKRIICGQTISQVLHLVQLEATAKLS